MKRLFAICLLSLTLALVFPVQLPAREGGSEAAAEGKHEGGSNDLIWKIANFLILAGGLGYLIAKKAPPFFAARTAEIRKGLDESAKLKKDADLRYSQIEQRLANLGAEIEALRKQATRESAAEGERVRVETARDLKKVQAQAEQEIESAAKAARQDLREYAAELAIRLAEKRIRERMTPDVDGTLLNSMLQDLAKRSNDQTVRPS